MVLVCSRCCCALWRASDFHPPSIGADWRRPRRVCSRGECALSILIYLAVLWLSGRWNQKFSAIGFNYSVLTGICVGAGTIAFFLLFQKVGPLSAVPGILAGGAAIIAIAGVLLFHVTPFWQRLAV